MFPDSIEELSRFAAESSLTTHASEQCISACRYMTLVLAGLLHGIDRDVVLAPDWQPLVQLVNSVPLHPAIADVAGGSFRRKQPPEIKGSGWVVQSLEAALWAFHQAESFEEAVLRAVNLGNDADTTGAVCGQFAGAYWGASGIPKRWRDDLARRDLIETAIRGIVQILDARVLTRPAWKRPELGSASAGCIPNTGGLTSQFTVRDLPGSNAR